MHKRLLTILAMITLSTVLLNGCGNKQEEPARAESTTETVEVSEDTTTKEMEEVTPEPTEEPIPEPTEEPTTEPVAEPQAQAEYTYTDMSTTMYATQTVNVRNLPNTDGEKIGSLSTNQEVTVNGTCNETGWYRFDYNGVTAYVSNNYLSDTKIEVAQAEPEQTQQSTQASTSYEAYTWYDMGDFFFIIVNTKVEGASDTSVGGIDYSGAQATLQARYPAEKIYLHMGTQMQDGRWCFFAYTESCNDSMADFFTANNLW